MDKKLPKELEAELQGLEREVKRLAGRLETLHEENRLLTERMNALSAERAQLANKNMMVQSRVEAMITRLKGLEVS
ncbi:MAG: TIGR02449 family protein [Gammaproteobacteria bacterium]